MTEMETFDTTIQKTNMWLKSLMDEEGWEDRHRAYLALRAALQTLRDRLTMEEAIHLSAQLPMLIRGFYMEGWEPGDKPVRWRTKREFLDSLASRLPKDPDLDPERVARAVFSVLSKKISEGEIHDILVTLPKELRELWPKASA
ncbi:MAG: DUF2267 domain-containing protein [Syntrophales bacterium]|nr:DUF2267 domain-containing protein [Syntrophales bacterium]HPL62233.1 DUF2267 domain-containing protein [Syntrophales bacterium]